MVEHAGSSMDWWAFEHSWIGLRHVWVPVNEFSCKGCGGLWSSGGWCLLESKRRSIQAVLPKVCVVSYFFEIFSCKCRMFKKIDIVLLVDSTSWYLVTINIPSNWWGKTTSKKSARLTATHWQIHCTHHRGTTAIQSWRINKDALLFAWVPIKYIQYFYKTNLYIYI